MLILRSSRQNLCLSDLICAGSIPVPDGSVERKYQNSVSYQPRSELSYARKYYMSVLDHGLLMKERGGSKSIHSDTNMPLPGIFRKFLILIFWIERIEALIIRLRRVRACLPVGRDSRGLGFKW
jgi:hypothetical protein